MKKNRHIDTHPEKLESGGMRPINKMVPTTQFRPPPQDIFYVHNISRLGEGPGLARRYLEVSSLRL